TVAFEAPYSTERRTGQRASVANAGLNQALQQTAATIRVSLDRRSQRAAAAAALDRYCDTRSRCVLLNAASKPCFSHGVVSPVPTLRGRRWQRWGLKHAVKAGKLSRTVD